MLRQVLSNHRHHIPASLSTRISSPLNRQYSLILSNLSAVISSDPELSFHDVQIRWKRRDGNKKFLEQRKPTSKQKKKYHRRQRELFHEKVGKHSPPGSKAGIRRQENEEIRQQYLKWDEEEPAKIDYNVGDAIVDDIIGNSATITAEPTPEPVFLGHKHQKFYEQLATKMAVYKYLLSQEKDKAEESRGLVDYSQLPNDQDISLLVRAFRDSRGSRRKPVGIAKTLEHLLKDLEVPIALFGVKTFTSLLTCCSNPTEARRIFRLMQEYQHPICEVSWAILVDIHAKLGDFEGCDQVMREMVTEGVHPTLTAYTSLLAGCYKAVNSGDSSRKTKIKAGELGWAKWKEMRITGVEADAMAYGAILRLMAARGQAERAKDLLEEMYNFEVKPTTLCFTSALRAIARSHQIAIRFENGASRKNRRRQMVASYHGRLAREVVILAENTEVEFDDGFIAALMLCAGTAGDSATAKAILLASEVRKLDHLRTIGSDDHLLQLKGGTASEHKSLGMTSLAQRFLAGDEEAANTIMEKNLDDLPVQNSSPKKKPMPSFEEREYGTDCRVLSTLLQACAQAVNSNRIGEIWEGRENKGYLCINSLLSMEVKPEPKYHDNSIPGVASDDISSGNLKWDEEEPEHLSKRLRRKKFEGIELDDTGTNLDDLDPALYKYYKQDDPALNRRNPDASEEVLPDNDPAWDMSARVANTATAESFERGLKDEQAINNHERKLKLQDSKGESNSKEEKTNDPFHDADKYANVVQETEEEWYFDKDDRKWKTKPSEVDANLHQVVPEYEASSRSLPQEENLGTLTEDDINGLKPPWETDVIPPTFEEFFDMLQEDIDEDGSKIEFSEEEARELYEMISGDDSNGKISNVEKDLNVEMAEINKELEELDILKKAGEEEFEYMDATEHKQLVEMAESSVGLNVPIEEYDIEGAEDLSKRNTTFKLGSNEDGMSALEPSKQGLSEALITDDNDYMMAELKAFLPGMPEERLRKVKKAFKSNLNYPSILTLTTILRENMPERVTSYWLKRKNIQNAYFVVEKAKEDGLMNEHLLNSTLQLEASIGSIDRALSYHDTRFREYNLVPSQYSDRLVLEMLVKNRRTQRALEFKEKVEEDGRNLDLISYGILIEDYAKHSHLGSALMLLKECVSVHGAPPNEKALKKLRLLCRQQNVTEETGLEELAGPDPLEWLRHGEAYKKREYSKKGRRQVNLPGNRLTDI